MNQEEIVQDFRRRYEGTFIFVQEPSSTEERLFHVDAVEASYSKLGTIHLNSPEVGRIRINFGSAHTLRFAPTPVGVFQHERDACICRRKPVKQYRRGLCYDNTFLSIVTSLVYKCDLPFHYETVSSAYERKTYTMKEALSMLSTNKYRSVALSNNYSVSLPFTKTDKYVLLFWDVAIATLYPNGTIHMILENLFAPQVNQILLEEKGA
jgi:hypothetical protein